MRFLDHESNQYVLKAAHAWEEHQKKEGKEIKHEKLKEFA